MKERERKIIVSHYTTLLEIISTWNKLTCKLTFYELIAIFNVLYKI